jgi:hypothetical protein
LLLNSCLLRGQFGRELEEQKCKKDNRRSSHIDNFVVWMQM